MSALRRIGHKGAHHISPGNTLASFDAALEADVDMVEFDVLPEHLDGTGRLLLAHDYGDVRARAGAVVTLEEGLAHFAGEAFGGIELDVDLKLPGYELRVVDALREAGLAERTLISTMETDSLPVVRAAAPEIRLGWSLPKLRRNPLANPFTVVPALIVLQALKRIVPGRVARAMREGRIDAVMVHHALATKHLVEAVAAAGGEVYVWTVDDAPHIARLEALGVTGVITNDPRLFGPRPAPR